MLPHKEFWPTAIHEAAHAVVFRRVMGVTVREVAIGRNLKPSSNFIWHGYVRTYRPGRGWIVHCLAVAMAGKIAENIFFGMRQSPSGADAEEITKLLRGFSKKRRRMFLSCAARVARKAIHHFRREMIRIANYLMIHSRIRGTARLDRIMAG